VTIQHHPFTFPTTTDRALTFPSIEPHFKGSYQYIETSKMPQDMPPVGGYRPVQYKVRHFTDQYDKHAQIRVVSMLTA
jgi:hypothetical protein